MTPEEKRGVLARIEAEKALEVEVRPERGGGGRGK